MADFAAECRADGINVKALRNGRIHAHPAPGRDFGSPRWIFGLMNIANLLHPEVFRFDLDAKVNWFYQEFYMMEFCLSTVNRSFSKPSNQWRFWQNAAGSDRESVI